MSGQPSTNPSAPRPSANGVGAGGMTSSQQRIDPQTASSTSNGQSGSMSQSNLNSIVRRKVSMLSSVCITFVKNHCCLLYVSSALEQHRDSTPTEAGGSQGGNRHLSRSTGSCYVQKHVEQSYERGAVAVLSIDNTSCVARESHASTRPPCHASSIIQHRSF